MWHDRHGVSRGQQPRESYIQGTPKFVIDEAEPFSSWLLPRQSASYSTESAHEIGADIEVGGETELSGAVAKAKVSLKIKIAEKNSVKRNFTVSDKNDSKKAYRVRLAAWAGRLRGLRVGLLRRARPRRRSHM